MRLRAAIPIAMMLAAVSACTDPPALDETLAKSIVADRLRFERFWAPASDILPLMSKSTHDYSAMVGDERSPAFLLGRLLQEKLVTQSTTVVHYPNVSGTWAGESGPGRFPEKYTMQLQQGAASNTVTGTCELSAYGQTWRSALTGVVYANGTVELDPTDGACLGSFNTLRYQYRDRGTTASLEENEVGNVVLTGPASGQGQVTVTTYEYTFSPEVRTSSARGVELGRYEIGAVSNLARDGETRGQATFSWRVSLNKLGSLLLHEPVGGSAIAKFVRRSDGTWALAEPIRF